jgi:curli biogenesis system outer membrane secretion channel CsgG
MRSIRSIPVIMLFVLSASWPRIGGTQQPPPAGPAEPPHKVRLAVIPFKNVATSIPQGQDVGRAVADMLITELFKLKRYELVERSQLDKLMQERDLRQSDLVESSARDMAKILKCDALVVGSISQYSETRQDRNFAFYRKEAATFTVGIEFRILDAQTGTTRLAESAVGTAEKEGRVGGLFSDKQKEGAPQPAAPSEEMSGGYGEAARQAVDILIAKLRTAFPIEGYVADIDADRITITLGRSDNVAVGQRFRVIKLGKEIIDPVTHEKLGAKTEDIGEIEVIEVSADRFSTARVVAATGKVEVGNKVIAMGRQPAPPQPQMDEEKSKPKRHSKKKDKDDDEDEDKDEKDKDHDRHGRRP